MKKANPEKLSENCRTRQHVILRQGFVTQRADVTGVIWSIHWQDSDSPSCHLTHKALSSYTFSYRKRVLISSVQSYGIVEKLAEQLLVGRK